MKLKEIFATALFVLFLGLCGAELVTAVMTAQSQTLESVRYTRGIEQSGSASQKKQDKPSFNLDEILKETDLDG